MAYSSNILEVEHQKKKLELKSLQLLFLQYNVEYDKEKLADWYLASDTQEVKALLDDLSIYITNGDVIQASVTVPAFKNKNIMHMFAELKLIALSAWITKC